VPLSEIPKYIHPETRSLIESAVEQAWQELKSDDPPDVALARRKLAGTIVALTSVGETDPDKLKRFALHAARGMAQKRWARDFACATMFVEEEDPSYARKSEQHR
jgi:hypothetical protein